MNPSAWNEYPTKYKFFGMQINASDKKTVYKRVKFDLLQLFSYIGGLALVLFLMAQCVVSSCARTSLNGQLGNRLYTWVPPPSLMHDSKREDSKLDMLDNTLYRKQRHDMEYAQKLAGKGRHQKFASRFKIIPVPPCLDCVAFVYGICFCCKPKWFRDYEEALKEVDKDIDRSLDVVDFMRRLRMHGFALTSFLQQNQRKFISNHCM